MHWVVPSHSGQELIAWNSEVNDIDCEARTSQRRELYGHYSYLVPGVADKLSEIVTAEKWPSAFPVSLPKEVTR